MSTTRHNAVRLISRFLLAAVLILPLLNSGSTARAASNAIRINFQNNFKAVPIGYYRDFGQGYGPRNDPDQGSGLSYGWVDPSNGQPLDLITTITKADGTTQVLQNGRDRSFISDNTSLDQRLDTFIHMQYNNAVPNTAGVPVEGAWQIALSNGLYDVVVSVGDPKGGSNPVEKHSIRIEGVTVIDKFMSSGADGVTTATRFKTATTRVNLSDGMLNVDAVGGTNTKINYIDILPVADPNRPYVLGVNPADGAKGVLRNVSITTSGISLPTGHGGIRSDTIDENTVKLLRTSDQVQIAASVNTTGGGDAITLQPNAVLDPNTQYTFQITDGVLDADGAAMVPFTSSFTTGTAGGSGGSSSLVAFDQVRNAAQVVLPSSLAVGPDHKLYISTLEGYIYRYTIAANGALSNQQKISTVFNAEGGKRAIIGLRFDPAATADNLILWVSHNGPYVPQGAADWTGKIARLSGANLENFQNYVVNLPHSYKDHMNNSLDFGPDGKLYISVGSNSAMGAPDSAWGQRAEHLLSAAILRIDISKIASPPLNVKTEDGGSYDPYAANAPVTIYASGVRNAYDLVWHSNGQLYTATNGSAAGGNAPGTPANIAAASACQNRVDKGSNGDYTGPSVPAFTKGEVEKDWLFRITQGGYYGHPNPTRCEWVMNGGNPTAGADLGEALKYPVGTQPDRNYRGYSYDFGANKSPDGTIEYKSNTFEGQLKGKLLIIRYSQENDIIVLDPSSPTKDISGAQEKLPGMFGFNNPLDLTEDTTNGNLYVIELSTNLDPANQDTTTIPAEQLTYAASKIVLLRPVASTAPRIQIAPSQLVFTDKADTTASTSQSITISNVGQSAMTVQSITLSGTGANQFSLVGPLPTSIAAGDSATVPVLFNPSTPGPKIALASVATNASNGSTVEVVLRGLGTLGSGGANEPSLQWILDTYEIAVNVGDDDPSTGLINSSPAQQKAALLGEEIKAQRLLRADNANPVIIEPLAVFGPTGNDPVTQFGWYPSGSGTVKNQLFEVGNSPSSNGQRLNPVLKAGASLSFDPGDTSFGFYSVWPFFGNRVLYSEDSLNTFSGAIPHHVRIFPLKDSAGTLVPNAYIVATEETTSGIDFQDVVVIVRNVKPAADAPPTASAGDDLAVGVGASVTLNGTANSPAGRTLSVQWTQTVGDAVTLTNATTLQPSFTAPATQQLLTFKLTVSDGLNPAVIDTVNVAVIDSSIANVSLSSSSPTVLGQVTTFNASAPGVNGVSFAWDFGDGSNGSGASVSHTYAAEGTYVARVTASKSGQQSVQATLEVQVTNAAPTPQAGTNRSVQAGALVTLDASASSDSDGHTPLSFSWAQVSGTPVKLNSPNSAKPTFIAPNTSGGLVFRVTVADSYGKSAQATVTITVTVPGAPVVNAGTNLTVRSGAAVALNGTASSPASRALTYQWTQIGGTQVTLSRATTLSPTFTAPTTSQQLVLTFRLSVSDGVNSPVIDTVTVTVVVPSNNPYKVYLPGLNR